MWLRAHRGAVVLGVAAMLAAAVTWMLMGPSEPWQRDPLRDDTLEGKAIYAASCAGCHGGQGEGQPGWKSQRDDGTYPAPPHDATGHTWHHADGLLFNIVEKGGAYAAPAGFKSAMPG